MRSAGYMNILKKSLLITTKYNAMAFKKGNSGNPSGRPKGSENKMTGQLRSLITDFLEQRFVHLVTDFNKLQPKDRIKVYIELLQYSVPKLQAVSNSFDF